MRASLPVPSADEMAQEHEEMRQGLEPAQKRDLDAHFEQEQAARDTRAADRQALYDKKMV